MFFSNQDFVLFFMFFWVNFVGTIIFNSSIISSLVRSVCDT
uniref:Uncharacterized protein n=1 Tax=Rhizophora mucronata TaxID=61149 RepID=A0A2P2P6Z8_RHIMU